jgi:YHS domain-containing protein
MAMESILYFLLWAGLFFVMMRFGCGAHVMGHRHHHSDADSERPNTPSDGTRRWAPPEKDIDPVCRMTVETAKARTAVHEGHVYHFCSQDCRSKFESEPAKYLVSAPDPASTKEHHHAR